MNIVSKVKISKMNSVVSWRVALKATKTREDQKITSKFSKSSSGRKYDVKIKY